MERIAPAMDFPVALSALCDRSRTGTRLPGGCGGIAPAIAWGLALHGAGVAGLGRS